MAKYKKRLSKSNDFNTIKVMSPKEFLSQFS
jgi:hypothetical protein